LVSLVDGIGLNFLEQGVFGGSRLEFPLVAKILAWRAMARGLSLGRATSQKWMNTVYELATLLQGNDLRAIEFEQDGQELSRQLSSYYETTEDNPAALGAFGQFTYDLLVSRYQRSVEAANWGVRRRARIALHTAALACEHTTTVADRRRAATDALEILRQQLPWRLRVDAAPAIENLWGIMSYFIDDTSLWRDFSG
jgi:hypothetical protein